MRTDGTYFDVSGSVKNRFVEISKRLLMTQPLTINCQIIKIVRIGNSNNFLMIRQLFVYSPAAQIYMDVAGIAFCTFYSALQMRTAMFESVRY